MSHKIIKSGEALQKFIGEVISETLNKKRIFTEEESKDALATGDITLEDVVEKLNVIRSGKSFKDEEVKSNMEKYVNDLDEAERTALLSFLKGISEIVTAGIEGDKATEPGEKPANVSMEKKSSQKTVKIKPTVIKKPAGEEQQKAEKKEDTTPPIKATK
jgi:hypothetical protein